MTVRDLTILGCSSQQPTRLRNHGAYLLRWNEEGFLLDPGEGTQRQFIYADVSPTCVNRILISHFHGDHCLGLGSMLMRLNLDGVAHPIHCYYPAGGKIYFDRLRYGTIYRNRIQIIEHPVTEDGIVHEDDAFAIEARFLKHGVENVGYRIREKDRIKFDKEKLEQKGVRGPCVKEIERERRILVGGREVRLEEVSVVRRGDVFASVIDTKPCRNAVLLAKDAALLLAESTYLEAQVALADKYDHMTAGQAATLAREACAKKLILTHFSARYRDLSGFVAEAGEIFPETDVADDFKRFVF
ncbi:MAG: ribonuclease Z [Simkaniaceae bacterium]|nr:ribonuclease Z [Simkaniaceae bacterium]